MWSLNGDTNNTVINGNSETMERNLNSENFEMNDKLERDVNRRKRNRNALQTDDEGKWRPFWQRGHTTLDDLKHNLRVKHPRKIKLYHSNIDLSSAGRARKKVKISKSVSLLGLNHGMPPIENIKRYSRNNSKKLTRTNSHLNLPQIEPDVEINGASQSRGNSAVTSGKSSSRNGRSSGMREQEPETEPSSEEDDDVYQSDDDPVVSRKNLDKAGEYIVEHDWILKEELAKEARQVKSLHNKIQIALPDEDPLETIQSRMDEINMMVKPRAELGNYLETIDPEQKNRIVKYKHIDHNEIRNKKRKNWTAMDRFQDAVYKVVILYRACHPRRKYLSDDKPDTAPDGVKKIKQRNNHDREIIKKSSLGFEMQLALATQPRFRTQEDVKKITQILRATKAFKHLFPAQLEEQLARVVAYERYDTRRIIAQQGRDPERFYFILTGKVNKVREYRLLSGVVTREEGSIEKSSTTDPQEMSQNWPREHHLVAKGNVEVLILDRHDFADLLHTCKGPPIDFLQGLDLFKEFPCEEFANSPDAIDFRYYGQEKLIVKDSNRTPWLHVIKTGRVKVVRVQAVIDVQNEDKFSGQSKEELGCVRPFSHASAMLGLLAKQRKMKSIEGAISFPEESADYEVTQRPAFERSETEYSWNQKMREAAKQISSFENPLTRMYRPSLVNIHSNNSSEDNTPRPNVKKKQRANSSPSKEARNRVDEPAVRSNSGRLDNIVEDNESSETGDSNSIKRSKTPRLVITSPTLKSTSPTHVMKNDTEDSPNHRQAISFFPPISNERKNSGEFVPHGTYLTRERTDFDPVYKKKAKKEMLQRDTYLQLDVLKPGDIFGLAGVAELFRSMYPLSEPIAGLEHMEPQALASEAPGVTLVSDGAEIIKISKRFFLQHAKNNTMLKVETMQREYMSPEEAKTVMYDKETWKQYKTVLLQRTVEGLHRNQGEKVP